MKGPGLVQELLNAQEDASSEEDEELDEMERLQARLKKAGMEEAMERRNFNNDSQLTN